MKRLLIALSLILCSAATARACDYNAAVFAGNGCYNNAAVFSGCASSFAYSQAYMPVQSFARVRAFDYGHYGHYSRGLSAAEIRALQRQQALRDFQRRQFDNRVRNDFNRPDVNVNVRSRGFFGLRRNDVNVQVR